MEIISNTILRDGTHEIVIKRRFLFWSYTTIFRKRNGRAFRFKNGKYYELSFSENYTAKELYEYNPVI